MYQRKLYYYSDQNQTQPKGIISFDIALAEVRRLDANSFKYALFLVQWFDRIDISGSKRSFTFKAHQPEIAEEWVSELEKHIEESKNHHKKWILTESSAYWKVFSNF